MGGGVSIYDASYPPDVINPPEPPIASAVLTITLLNARWDIAGGPSLAVMTYDFGDGSPVEDFNLDVSGANWVDHTYAVPGTYNGHGTVNGEPWGVRPITVAASFDEGETDMTDVPNPEPEPEPTEPEPEPTT